MSIAVLLAATFSIDSYAAESNTVSEIKQCVPKRTPTGRISRSTSEVRRFKAQNACPATGAKSIKCKGYVVDHIVPLCACGLDKVTNMQWQSIAQSKLKDKEERTLCADLRKNQ